MEMMNNMEVYNTDDAFKQYYESKTVVEPKNQTSMHVQTVQTTPSKTVFMMPFKKLAILKSSRKRVANSQIASLTETEGRPEMYHQRKRMLPDYRELFTALMKLPDKEMQKKLLAVINSHQATEHRTVETQTDAVEIKELYKIKEEKEETSTKGNPVYCNSNGSGNDTPNSKDSNVFRTDTVKKRKRKRKVSLPQANKESRAKHIAKMNKPKIYTTYGVGGGGNKGQLYNEFSFPKRHRIDSFLSECSSDIGNIYDDTEMNYNKEIEHIFTQLDNGLLTVQDAVIRDQTNKLDLRIKIWKNKGYDLNEILTEEYEDLLQLAVLNSCNPSIVSLLLENGLNPNSLDEDSNTIVHLAILNDITVESLELLMKRIELRLLLTFNDDGYTPLHLAIRQDRFLLAECLINVVDERLVRKVYYESQLDKLETDETVLKNQFKDYYEKICLNMATDDQEENVDAVENHDLKQKLLQAGDRKSGNTVLYFAIDNRFEHLIYFLLAHLTDPRTENLSGLDCKTYFSEFGKSLNLSLNIDNTMEKVINLLS